MLVKLVYQEKRNSSWINNKKLIGLVSLLVGVTGFGYLFLTDFYPTLMQYGLFFLITGVLLVLAWRIPSDMGKGDRQALSPKKLFIVGFFIIVMLFLFFGTGPYIINEPLILMIIGLGLVIGVFLFSKQYDWNKDSLYHKFSLIAGALFFFIFLTPFQELDRNRPDNSQGIFLVGIVAIILLLFVRKKLKSN
jgi:phosphoglycerol transferase MdoB-like AlkP superfamily enzyme